MATKSTRSTARQRLTSGGKRKAPIRGWKPADTQLLRSLAKTDISARAIARRLKRTEGATRQKAHAEGISFKSAARTAARKKIAATRIRTGSKRTMTGAHAKTGTAAARKRPTQKKRVAATT